MGVGIGISGIFRANGAPPVVAPINLFTQDLTLAANRTHDLNGNSVTFLKSNFEFRAVDALSNTIGFRYRNLANTQNIFSIKNQGRVEINGSDALVLLGGTSYTAYWLTTPTAQMSMFNEGANSVGFRQNTNDLLFQRGGGAASETHTSISVLNGSWNFGLNWASATAMLNVGMGTLNQARLGVQAINGNSGERVLGLRNHTNTGWLAEFRNDGKQINNNSTPTGDFSLRSRTNTATDIGMYLEQNSSTAVWYNDYNGNQWQKGKLEINAGNAIGDDIIKFGYGGNYRIGIIGSAWGATSEGSMIMKVGASNIATLQKFSIRNFANQDKFIYDNETASLQLSALNGNSGERVLGLRNHTNTGWLAEFRNNGIVGIGGSANASYQHYIQSSLTFSSQIDNYATSGIGQRITMFGGGAPTALILNAFNGTTNTALSIANGGIQMPLTGDGTQIGMSTGDKFAFWGATPQTQQVFATGTGKTADDIITFMQSIGLCRQS